MRPARYARAASLVLGIALTEDRPRTLLSGALTLGTHLSGILLALALAAFAAALQSGASQAAVSWALVVALVLVASEGVEWGERLSRVGIYERTQVSLDSQLMQLTARLPSLDHCERAEYHDRVSALRADAVAVAALQNALFRIAALALQVGVTALLLARVDLVLLVIPATGLILIGAEVVSAARESDVQPEVDRLHRLGLSVLALTLDPRQAKEVRVFGNEEPIQARVAGVTGARVALEDRVGRVRAQLASGAAGLFAVALAVVFAHLAPRALAGEIAFGGIVLAFALGAQVSGQMSGVSRSLSRLAWSLRAAERYLWIIEYAAEADASRRPAVPAPVPERVEHGLRLEGVSFRYPDATAEALSSVSVEIPGGSVVAVVGENGAGKSTLMKLLLRLHDPSAGRILVDGVDLADLDPDAWRTRCSALFQDYVCPEVTLREAVALGDLERIDDAGVLTRALERARSRDLLDELGLEAQLGTRFRGGRDLSAGQWQKLALARAWLYERPRILVMDEPTSALDPTAERELALAYLEEARDHAARTGCVSFLVTHRFSTVRGAGLILVLDRGRLVERGDHGALMSTGGLYAQLYSLQARGYR